MRYLLPSLGLLAGCAGPAKNSPVAHTAAEAAHDRYQAIQEAQKSAPQPNFEILPLVLPERTEEGIIRAPSTDYVRLPRRP